jgi:hypothetical protein
MINYNPVNINSLRGEILKKTDIKGIYSQFASLWIMALISLLLTVGYWVTPVLFVELSQKQAGEIAGLLFNGASAVVLSGLFLLIGVYIVFEKSLKHVKTLGISLVLLMILRFWLSPWMAKIKAIYPLGIGKNSADWPLFAGLHGVYQLVYLAIVLLLLYWSLKTLFRVSIKSSPK